MERGQKMIPSGKQANGTPRQTISWICKVCGKEGFSNHIRDHIEIKHLEVSFSCDHCDKTLSSRDSIRKHKRVYHKSKLWRRKKQKQNKCCRCLLKTCKSDGETDETFTHLSCFVGQLYLSHFALYVLILKTKNRLIYWDLNYFAISRDWKPSTALSNPLPFLFGSLSVLFIQFNALSVQQQPCFKIFCIDMLELFTTAVLCHELPCWARTPKPGL